MTSNQQTPGVANWLSVPSKKYPVLLPAALFITALAFFTIDIFVLRLDELLGEIILAKSLGLIHIVGLGWATSHSTAKNFGRSLKITGMSSGGLFLFAFLIPWLVLMRL